MSRLSLRLLLLCLVAACGPRAQGTAPVHAPASAPEADAELPPGLRLPNDTRPTHYELVLQVDPAAERFVGQVSIDVELSAARETLWLHAQGLRVRSAKVQREDGQWLEARFEELGPDGLAALRLPAPVDAGALRIEMTYDAPFGEKLRGLYRVRQAGDTYAFTQFEPLSAREAFPCFDEPRFKTPFDVRLVVPAGQVAIANTLEREVRAWPEGGVEHVYATTEPLPTYLLAFAVGPLDVVDAPPLPPNAIRDRALPFRGVAVRGRGAELSYALERTPAMLEALERYFDTPYPYDKLDVIAVPDFSAGAMENAGAITFREVFLLLGDEASQQQRHDFAEVMAHELAHQWFGNLVTMPFWEDLWLNEAFATWMATHVVEGLYPDYHAGLEQLRATHSAMGIDAKHSARAIRQPIEESHDIYNAFDGITYSKGGAVLAMFEGYMGEEGFRDGLRSYMRAHAFGSATADDLVAALSEVADEDLRPAFFSFLTQPGVPRVDVRLQCDEQGVRVQLQQQRYEPLGGQAAGQALWQIPVCLRYASGDKAEPTSECVWLREREETAPLAAKQCPTWLMPNAGARGYYRWSLPAAGLASLAQQGWPALSDAERQSTVESLVAALNAGAIEPEHAYPVLLRFVSEGDRHVTAAALAPLTFADDYLLDADGRAVFHERLAQVLRPRVKQLGLWPEGSSESGERALLRRTLVSALCLDARDPSCRKAYARAGQAWLEGADTQLTSDVLGLALTVALQDGPAGTFETARARLVASEDALERGRLLWALGSVERAELAERARALALDEALKVNEVMMPLWAQSRLPAQREATWAWALQHLDALEARLPGRRAGQVLGLSSGLCSTEAAAQVREQGAAHSEQLVGGARELASAVEGIELCAARVQTQRKSARRFFTSVRTQ